MPAIVAALDADVLVPIIACDFLLTAFDLGLYEPVVSTQALDEVEHSLTHDFPNLNADAVRARVDAMRATLDDQTLTANLDGAPRSVNLKDRHVVATAIAVEATVLVSNDRRLRDQLSAIAIGIEPLTLDEFGLRLWAAAPDLVNAVIDALVAKRHRPPITRPAILAALQSAMPRFATAITE